MLLLFQRMRNHRIPSSWLIKCVVGGVICQSPVVIPLPGGVVLSVVTFDMYPLISTGSRILPWNAFAFAWFMIALFDYLSFRFDRLFEFFLWLGLDPNAWKFTDPWRSIWNLPLILSFESLIKDLIVESSWLTRIFPVLSELPCIFHLHSLANISLDAKVGDPQSWELWPNVYIKLFAFHVDSSCCFVHGRRT